MAALQRNPEHPMNAPMNEATSSLCAPFRFPCGAEAPNRVGLAPLTNTQSHADGTRPGGRDVAIVVAGELWTRAECEALQMAKQVEWICVSDADPAGECLPYIDPSKIGDSLAPGCAAH